MEKPFTFISRLFSWCLNCFMRKKRNDNMEMVEKSQGQSSLAKISRCLKNSANNFTQKFISIFKKKFKSFNRFSNCWWQSQVGRNRETLLWFSLSLAQFSSPSLVDPSNCAYVAHFFFFNYAFIRQLLWQQNNFNENLPTAIFLKKSFNNCELVEFHTFLSIIFFFLLNSKSKFSFHAYMNSLIICSLHFFSRRKKNKEKSFFESPWIFHRLENAEAKLIFLIFLVLLRFTSCD